MKDYQAKVLLEQIGTDGLKRLESICAALPVDSSYKDEPFKLSCRLLWRGLDQLAETLRKDINTDGSVQLSKTETEKQP